jgi:transcriptional regulator
MSPANPERLHGTLELLVLKLLEAQPMNGYAIGRRIQDLSDDHLHIEEGSLYPALYRMERRGWLRAEWGKSENNRRAKFYGLTKAGRRHLEQDVEDWGRFAEAVGKILESA